jgi:choline dehydrogenase-like flavoprotein
MGTTIMGNDAKTSVVDSNCRTHDHPNLFIAGTSVMPSASCMNPTLTGAALSLRLADHLLKVVKV